MNATESKALKEGSRVSWRGTRSDRGSVTNTSPDSVTIAWDNLHVATLHHRDMQQIELETAPTSDGSKT